MQYYNSFTTFTTIYSALKISVRLFFNKYTRRQKCLSWDVSTLSFQTGQTALAIGAKAGHRDAVDILLRFANIDIDYCALKIISWIFLSYSGISILYNISHQYSITAWLGVIKVHLFTMQVYMYNLHTDNTPSYIYIYLHLPVLYIQVAD